MPAAHDQQLFLFLNADRQWPWLDKAMAVLSSLDFWLPFIVIAAAAMLVFGGFRARAAVVCVVISVGLLSAITGPLKNAFGRPRPNAVLAEARSFDLASVSPRFLAISQPLRFKPSQVSPPGTRGASFPSGHTANMFCFATVLAAFYGRRGAWAFAAAALVAVSRIATGSHWPSDIALTAPLAAAATAGLLALYQSLWRRFAPRVAPKLAEAHPSLFGDG